MKTIVSAVALSRWYGVVMGLNNVTFSIPPGITGLVGPNGAGKSTLIRIMTGQIRPSSGELTVFDQQPWDNPQVLAEIGYCPERETLHEAFKPIPWLTALAQLSGIPAGQAKRRAQQALEQVKLGEQHWKKRIGSYSKGMRQRVKLAQAILHYPKLIILDEPMNGLDPMGRQEVSDILKELAHEGVSILISSHILHELESLCENILILNWGRVLASGGQKEIRADLKNWSEQLFIRCRPREQLVSTLFQRGLLNGFEYANDPSGVTLRLEKVDAFYADWTKILKESGVEILEIRSQSRSLKNIFERVTG